jgi:tetratricopeptide (TPR) repeat protein
VVRERSHTVYRASLTAYVVTLVTFLIASFYPDQRLWGVNWWAYYPLWVKLGLLGVGLIVPAVMFRQGRRLDKPSFEISGQSYKLALSVIFIVAVLLFILLRTRVHFLGDGYTLLSLLSSEHPFIKPRNLGGTAIQLWLTRIFGERGETNALLAYRIVAIGAGVLYLAAMFAAAKRFFERRLNRLLFVAGTASAGFVLLFFGYVENYALFVVLVSLFVFLGMLVLDGQANRWWLLPALALATFMHVFGVALLVPAVYAFTANSRFSERVRQLPINVKIGLIVAGLAIGFLAYFQVSMSDRFIRFALLPIKPGPFTVEGYTLFSANHLLDFTNMLLLLSPGLVVFLAATPSAWPLSSVTRQHRWFLSLATLACAGVAFVFDPKLGMARDWDLFAFAGVPLVILAFVITLRSVEKFPQARQVAILMVLLSLLTLMPRAVSQVFPEIAIAHFQTYLDLDVKKSGPGRYTLIQYYKGVGEDAKAEAVERAWEEKFPTERWLKEALSLSGKGDYEAAASLYRRIIEENPLNHAAWTNLGACYIGMHHYDTAVGMLRIADGLNPYSAAIYHNMAHAYFGLGQNKQAEKYWLEALSVTPDHLESLIGLATLYRRSGQTDKYRELLVRIATNERAPAGIGRLLETSPDSALIDELAHIDLDSAGVEKSEIAQMYYQAGHQLYQRGDAAGAERYWLKSLQQDTALLDVLLGLNDLYREQNRQAPYVENFVRIARREDAPLNFVKGLAGLQLEQGDYENAALTLKRVLASGGDSAYVSDLIKRYPDVGLFF